jgi:hypothetical protein
MTTLSTPASATRASRPGTSTSSGSCGGTSAPWWPILSGRAAAGKGTRFWNLSANTVTSFQLSPAGKESWGKDQCKNDKDGSVDHDERLTIKDVATGVYDAKLTDSAGRKCTIKNVEVTEGKVFSIAEKQLTDCQK